jgi:hypothetical protein
MKKVLLSTVILYIISIFGANAQNTSIPLKIKYMDGEKVIPNTVVYLLYQEPEKTELVEKTANTGSSGEMVSFQVPLDKDGASYPFVVLFTKEDIDKAKEMVKTTTIRAYRIPPGENCESLQLTVTKGGGMGNDGCSIQMWSMGKK